MAGKKVGFSWILFGGAIVALFFGTFLEGFLTTIPTLAALGPIWSSFIAFIVAAVIVYFVFVAALHFRWNAKRKAIGYVPSMHAPRLLSRPFPNLSIRKTLFERLHREICVN